MKRFLAWREIQDLVVQHPLCRYTILPAGIIMVSLFSGLAMAVVLWCQYGWDGYSLSEGISRSTIFWAYPKAIDIGYCVLPPLLIITIGTALTGRVLPAFIGLIPTFFAWVPFDDLVMWLRLAVFVPPCLGLLVLDRQTQLWPKLSRRMKWLVWGTAAFNLGVVLFSLKKSEAPLQADLLMSLSAAFWFTVFFDFSWRFSSDRIGFPDQDAKGEKP